jgi:hypothetical protein
VIGMLYEDLTGASARDPVENTEALALDIALDLEEWGALWNNADLPFRTVCRLPIGSIGRDLRRGGRLSSRAKRTKPVSALQRRFFLHKDPPVRGRVLPQFCQTAVSDHCDALR